MNGLGNKEAKIQVYIENIPPLPQYQHLNTVKPMDQGEIADIAMQTGNHWRKIFNVFAKLAYPLNNENFTCWQHLRDQSLLQENSHYALLFEPPEFNKIKPHNLAEKQPPVLKLILGKGYASKLNLSEQALWLDNDFAVNTEQRYIICPYFDYRQLSNIKIVQLCQLINKMNHTTF